MTVPIWRLRLAQRGGRFFAIFMATVDALFSFWGSRNLGYSFLEALIVSGFIFVIQYGVGVSIAARINIGEKLQNAFFEEEGAWGIVCFVAGCFFILFIVGIYLYDIFTNFASFVDLKNVGGMETLALMYRNFWSVFWSAAIALGDEATNILIDFISGDEVTVTRSYLNATQGMSQTVYEEALANAQIRAAKKAGKEKGRNATF